MSKKVAIVMSVILFVLLLVLVVCEIRWPEAGSAWMGL